MSRLIGTVGFYDTATGSGMIHPDYNFQAHGLNLPFSSEAMRASGIEPFNSGLRITCAVSGGQASEIKPYDGTGELG